MSWDDFLDEDEVKVEPKEVKPKKKKVVKPKKPKKIDLVIEELEKTKVEPEEVVKPKSKKSKPKPKKKEPKKKGRITVNRGYEPPVTWYRSTAEILTGTSCRDSIVEAIDTIIEELGKKRLKFA